MRSEGLSPAGIIRTCVGCMKQDRKDAMVRIAVVDGKVVPDFEGRMVGRGGYLHFDDGCLERFAKSKVKEFKSLKVRIERDQRTSIIQAIRARLDRKAALE
ncbi:MAG: YlxR family protein [Candidatus Binataceae bacterium]